MTVSELIAYVQDEYGAAPEYLWENYPDCFVFRHRGSRKWFAVILEAPRAKCGLPGDGSVALMDVKCGPLLGGSYLDAPGVVPAWHMNKTHWLGVLLDGSAPDETVRELLALSYDLTDKKTNR